MNVPHRRAQGSIRFSLGRDTTQKDLDYTAAVLTETIQRLRSMSPVYADYRRKTRS